MNRWIPPSAALAVAGLAVAAGTLVPGAGLPVEKTAATNTRVSVVCPTVESATAAVRVATVTTQEPLRTAKVTQPQQSSEAAGLSVTSNPAEPVRVSAQRASVFGAATWSAASEGSARGLSGVACVSPQADHWFAGVDVGKDGQASLQVVNLDSTEAVVDLTAFGPQGRITAPRGLRVPGNSASAISLQVLERGTDPITLRLTTSQGRVAAFVRQFTWAGRSAVGSEWVPDVSAVEADLVLPGVAAGRGARTLVVTNPGEENASVDVSVLAADGTSQLAGVTSVQVPPLATRSFPLADVLGGRAAGLHLVANQGIVAGIVGDNGAPAAALDAVTAGVATALPPEGIWPLALGASAVASLQLVNPSATDASASVITTVGSAAPTTVEVTVPAGALRSVPLQKGAVSAVRIQTASGVLRGAVVVTRKLGKVAGVAVLDLVADETRTRPIQVVHDPHLG